MRKLPRLPKPIPRPMPEDKIVRYRKKIWLLSRNITCWKIEEQWRDHIFLDSAPTIKVLVDIYDYDEYKTMRRQEFFETLVSSIIQTSESYENDVFVILCGRNPRYKDFARWAIYILGEHTYEIADQITYQAWMNDMDNLRITTKGVSALGKSWLDPVLYYSNGKYGSYKTDNADFRKFMMCPEWEGLLPTFEPRLSRLEWDDYPW